MEVLREARPVFTPEQQRQIYMWFHGHCAYCGTELSPRSDDWHIDHVHPWSLGGANDPYNLALSCRPCNARKGNQMGWKVKHPPEGPAPTFGPVALEAKRFGRLANVARLLSGFRISTAIAVVELLLGVELGYAGVRFSDRNEALLGGAIILLAAWYLRRKASANQAKSNGGRRSAKR